jgi:D-tyrosyl-tRNA(Tyr) deacylase
LVGARSLLAVPSILFVLADGDPVAQAVAERWGPRPSTGVSLGDQPLRELDRDRWFVRRPGFHIHDDRLTHDLAKVRALSAATVVFPSIHRSEANTECFTVHPLGNLGGGAEVGGHPSRVVPTDPRRMTDALRRLAEAGASLGLSATYESTHHGPWLDRPAFFVEIGYGAAELPPAPAADVLAQVLPEITEDPADHVVVGIGGGHYVPHFTDLALRRHWAFGHLVSRHSLERTSREVLASALAATPGAEGFLFARAADADDPKVAGLAPRRRDGEAPRREAPTGSRSSASSRPSGT